MNMLRRFLPLLVVFLLVSLALPAFAQDDEGDQIIALVAASDDFSSWLVNYDGWHGNAYLSEDGTTWYVEFKDAADEEWLGYAGVSATTHEITESFVPRPLPPEVYAANVDRVQSLVLDDPEVQARILDPVLWNTYADYNRYDQDWEVWLSRGVDLLVVKATLDENNFSIKQITDPNVLDEEDALQAERDEAVNLAYTGEGIDAALDGHDDWTAYAENQHGHVWSVSFIADDTELYYALVNTEKDSVLQVSG